MTSPPSRQALTVTEKSYNTVAPDKNAVPDTVMADIQVPWDPNTRTSVAVYDYTAGNIQYVAWPLERIRPRSRRRLRRQGEARRAEGQRGQVGDVTQFSRHGNRRAVGSFVGGGEG